MVLYKKQPQKYKYMLSNKDERTEISETMLTPHPQKHSIKGNIE